MNPLLMSASTASRPISRIVLVGARSALWGNEKREGVTRWVWWKASGYGFVCKFLAENGKLIVCINLIRYRVRWGVLKSRGRRGIYISASQRYVSCSFSSFSLDSYTHFMHKSLVGPSAAEGRVRRAGFQHKDGKSCRS